MPLCSAEIISFYTRRRHSYEDSQPGSNAALARFIVEFCTNRTVTALNIGCATGLPLEQELQRLTNGRNKKTRLALGQLQLVSADVSLPSNTTVLQSLRHGLDNRKGPTHRVEAVASDMRCLPFSDSVFDLVVSNLAMDILPGDDRVATLNQAHRVLRPGGSLRAHLHTSSIADAAREQHGFELPHYFATTQEAGEAFEAAGFINVSVDAIHPKNDPGHDFYFIVSGGKAMGNEPALQQATA